MCICAIGDAGIGTALFLLFPLKSGLRTVPVKERRENGAEKEGNAEHGANTTARVVFDVPAG